MFKKSFTVNQTHKVSGADRKKIRKYAIPACATPCRLVLCIRPPAHCPLSLVHSVYVPAAPVPGLLSARSGWWRAMKRWMS